VASTDTEHSALAPTARRSQGGILEALASTTAIVTIVALGLNWFGAHLTFFGAPVVIDDEDVRNYWVLVAVLAVSQLATWVGAARRGAGKAWILHTIVAGTGLVAALLFAVTEAGPVQDQPEPSQPTHTGPVCYSGGDSDECPGG
jgi:hypothetical protein